MTQPAALRLADALEVMHYYEDLGQEAAAELRRLHAQRDADMWRDKYESVAGAEQRIYPLAEPVQAPHMYPLQSDRMRIDPVTGNVGIGTPQRPPEPVQEPVAWLWQHRETGRARLLMPNERTATDVAAAWDVVGPLYLAPPQRKPLTEEEIDSIWDSEKAFADIYAIARAVERAHGIGEHR